MDRFLKLREINNYLLAKDDRKARQSLFELLEYISIKGEKLSEVENHFCKKLGLYPYISDENADWIDKRFKSFCSIPYFGGNLFLHSGQLEVLIKLLNKEDILLSAPTSFGKTLLIEILLAYSNYSNILIIVPTISLMDELRRKFSHKFSRKYKIITTLEAKPYLENNLFILTPERFNALQGNIKFDLVVIDEFYKIDERLNSSRAGSLVNILYRILKGDLKNSQKIFLSPLVTGINIPYIDIDFQLEIRTETTVGTKFHREYEGKNKFQSLKSILNKNEKNLIYVKSPNELQIVAEGIINDSLKGELFNSKLGVEFSDWLIENYGSTDWYVLKLLKRGIGVHSGNLHRSIAQLIVKLFEDDGLNSIICTSSLIEGVNTSAKNLILWDNKIANQNLDFFTYKNIIGRSGRMFKYFIGHIYLLEKAPDFTDTELKVTVTPSVLNDLSQIDSDILQPSDKQKQIEKINCFNKIFGKENLEKILRHREIVDLKEDELIKYKDWISDIRSRNLLKSCSNPNNRRARRDFLYSISTKFSLLRGRKLGKTVQLTFFDCLTNNWSNPLKTNILRSEAVGIAVDDYFKLEKKVSYDFVKTTKIIVILCNILFQENINIDNFIRDLSNVFLPSCVFTLEEYGLPRTLAKKLNLNEFIDFESNPPPLIDDVLEYLILRQQEILNSQVFSEMDRYILKYFFSGLS